MRREVAKEGREWVSSGIGFLNNDAVPFEHLVGLGAREGVSVSVIAPGDGVMKGKSSV